MGIANGGAVSAGIVAREELGSREVARTAETAVSAAAAHAVGMVKAMHAMALERPRDLIVVREKLLAECRRPKFAECARYKLPRGGKDITGPSVRFAEAAARALTNLHRRTTILYEDDERRLGEVTIVDLESNLPYCSGFTIDKTVERRTIKPGDVVLSERLNSKGEAVYRIIATEAEVQQKQESLVSRIRRNLILELLPGDIKDEALEECSATLRRADSADPRATAKKLADSFQSLGIPAAQLQQYLGHAVDTVTPEEAEDLRGIYSAIADRETTWAEVMEAKSVGVSATTDERKEKVHLQKLLGTARVKDVKAYEKAMADAGVKGKPNAAQLPVETLRKVAVALGLVEQAKVEPEASGGGVQSEIKQWTDSQAKSPQADPGEES